MAVHPSSSMTTVSLAEGHLGWALNRPCPVRPWGRTRRLVLAVSWLQRRGHSSTSPLSRPHNNNSNRWPCSSKSSNNREWWVGKCPYQVSPGQLYWECVALVAIHGILHLVKSLQLIWRLGKRRWNLRMPYLQMSCSDSSPSNDHQGDKSYWISTSFLLHIIATGK